MARALLLLAVLFLLHYVINGSVITFQSTPDSLKQGLTTTLTLHCVLSDTAASGGVIGKRDVTQTTDNVLFLTSLVVMKDGKDVASVNSALPAHVMDGSTNVEVTGSVAGKSGRTGFLQLTIRDPTLNETGEFVCEANAVGVSGHVVTLSTSVEVKSSEPSIADLVEYMRDLSKKNEGLESKVKDLDQQNADLKKSNEVLEQTVSQLQNRSDTMVFFNARISTNPNYPANQDVVFDTVLDNKGDNYNRANGLFTCTVPGYYHFSLGCLSLSNRAIDLKLLHNGKLVFEIFGVAGNSYQAAANTATRQLAGGDVVKVSTAGSSNIDGFYCSFSGHLIKAL